LILPFSAMTVRQSFLDETAFALADQLLDGASSSSTIGVVSTPSVFIALKNRLRFWPVQDRPKLVLFEHDHRFSVFPEFVFYDFQRPLQLPRIAALIC
jgi:hypothetical protein